MKENNLKKKKSKIGAIRNLQKLTVDRRKVVTVLKMERTAYSLRNLIRKRRRSKKVRRGIHLSLGSRNRMEGSRRRGHLLENRLC